MHASTASDQSTAHHISLQVAVLVHHKVKKNSHITIILQCWQIQIQILFKVPTLGVASLVRLTRL